jgi:DNA-binding NtrC family response regulator
MRDNPKVLIVEDERRLRELLCDVLPTMGYEPVAARTAEQAFSLISEQAPDIVVLDLNLPVMDGMSFLDRFRQSHQHTPVVIMTGFGDLKSARQAIHHDVVDFLSKPCHLGEIEAALGRARQRLNDPLLKYTQEPAPTESDDDEQTVETIAEAERRMIYAALERNNGNRSAAAAELGISRRTLYNKLAEYERANA